MCVSVVMIAINQPDQINYKQDIRAKETFQLVTK